MLGVVLALVAAAIAGTPVRADSNTTQIRDADRMASSTFAYQWLVDDTEISAATSSTYTIRASDVGKHIKGRVSFTDDMGKARY